MAIPLNQRKLMTPEEVHQKIEELRQAVKRVEDRMKLTNRTIMNPNQAAKYLSISLSYLYKLTFMNKIPHHKPNGKILYFFQEELDEWIAITHKKN